MIVPPRHHLVVTATVKPGTDLAKAQRDLEDALLELESRYEQTPAGLGLTVAWGLPYFDRHVAAAAGKHLPFDRRAQKPALLADAPVPERPARHRPRGERRRAAHPQRPARPHRGRAQDAARRPRRLRAHEPPPRLRRRRLCRGSSPIAAGVPGAYLIPHDSELFLGFTSTQKAGLGPRRIANFETLGLVDLRGGYFRGGTHMHLSHIFEDLEAWYLNFEFQERVDTAFRPGTEGARERAGRPAGAEAGLERGGGRARLQPRRALRAQRVDPDELAPAPGHDRGRRHASTSRGRRSRSAPTSTRSTTRSRGRPIRSATASSQARPPASTSSSSTRRATTSTATGSRWTACCRTGRRCSFSRRRAARASTPCCARRTARTSSSRRAATGRSRSPSCDRRRQLDPGGARAAARARGRARRRRARHRVRRGRGGDGRDGALRRHRRARSGAAAAVARAGSTGSPAVELLEGDWRDALAGRGPFGLVFADGGRRYDWTGDPRPRRARRPDREGRPDARPRDRRRSRARVPSA